MRKSTFWNVTLPKVMTVYANLVFLALWVGFIIAIVSNRDWLDLLWIWVQALPLLPKIIIWILILPIMVGLSIWKSSWSTLASFFSYAGIVVWTLTAVRSLFKVFRK
ncbi:MAG: hypothetical protein MUO40_10300 [Anaerolineaceae bacterium]|nr:hypothetical protein [Anaerolineaceae bacterium]